MEKPCIKFNTHAPSDSLKERIISDLRLRERRREKKRATIFGLIACAAFALVIPALKNVFDTAAQSGFTRYASLAFSDWSTMANMWKPFAFSLAETAPISAVAMCLTALLLLTWSIWQTSRYVRAVRISFV